MKIIYCIYELGVGGGVERVLTAKANYLIEQGYEVHILTCRPLYQPPVYGMDKRVILHSFDIDYAADFRVKFGKRLFNTIKKMCQHYKLVRDYLMQAKADIVVTTHIYETAFLPYIKDGSKKVQELHTSKASYAMEREGRTSPTVKALIKLFEWRDAMASRRFDAVNALTHEDFLYRGSPKNMCVIPNPLPFVPEGRSSCDKPVVLSIGRHVPPKNFPLLVDIWATLTKRHPEWTLKIVGGGYAKQALINKVQAMGLENSILIEDETHDIHSYYQEASIFVMTSKFEGFGMVLAEAQSYAVPSVAFTCPFGPKDIIEDGVTGYHVEPNDKESFAKKLEQLMLNTELRQSMGQAAYKASARYAVETVMTQWLSLFASLTKKK